MRMRWQVAAALAAVTVVTGCTVTVGGSASPVPGQGPVTKVVDACTLLSPEQVDALGYKSPGRSVPASKVQRAPAMCLWANKDGSDSTVVINAGWSVDQPLDDFLQGAVPKSDPQQIGGFTWRQYGSIIPDDCTFYTVLGPKSFAYAGASAGELTKSCEAAKKIIPIVASHLPGGQPAPPITPPTPTSAEPSGPLMSVDPCTLVKPDQIAQLKNISPEGKKDNSTSVPNAAFCLWDDTDGDGGQKAFEVWLGPSTPADKWPGVNGNPPTETVDVNGKKWGIFPNMGGLRATCGATLPVTDTSSVQVVSGFIGDDSKTCDIVKQSLPFVTANLPSS